MFAYFLRLNIFLNTGCSFVKIKSIFKNPNLVLNWWIDLVLQSIITLIADFSSIKSSIDLFLCFFCQFISIFSTNWMIFYCDSSQISFLFLYVFHLTTIFHNYLLFFLCNFFNTFLRLYQQYLYRVFHRSFKNFFPLSHFIFLIHYLLKQNRHE